jgi:polyhydroxybutyrate depolymerase
MPSTTVGVGPLKLERVTAWNITWFYRLGRSTHFSELPSCVIVWADMLTATLAICTVLGVSQAPAIQKKTLEAVGFEWTYHVVAPESRALQPLVIVLHGAGGNGELYLSKNNWAREAQRERFIVCAPTGLPALPNRPSNFQSNPNLWNSGQLKGKGPRSRVDDVKFIDALIAQLKKDYAIDPSRIYVTGHSNGAGMTYRLAAERSRLFAAIAPVMGECAVVDPKLERGVPTLQIFGDKDPLNLWEGGTQNLPWGKREVPPAKDSIPKWREALGCPQKPRSESNTNQLWIREFGPGKDGSVLKTVVVKGQGHMWPGGAESGLRQLRTGPQVDFYDATQEVWKFFSAHSLKP